MTTSRRSLFSASTSAIPKSISTSKLKCKSKPSSKHRLSTRSKPISSSSSSDTITNLFQKLPPEYKSQVPPTVHSQLMTKTRETLRLLNSKITRGQKLCKGDSPETRSVIVLEHMLRQGIILQDGSMSTSVRVPLSVLGKLVGIGKKDVEKVGKAVGLFLEGIDAASAAQGRKDSTVSETLIPSQRQTRNLGVTNATVNRLGKTYRNVHQRNVAMLLKQKRDSNRSSSSTSEDASKPGISKDSDQHTTIRRSQNGHIITQQIQPMELTVSSSQYISLLSIKLQSCLHDPNSIEKKSKSLWWNIVQYKLGQDHLRRNAVIYDLQSKVKHYEGACFYFTVYDIEQGSIAVKSASSSPSKSLTNKKKMVKGRSKAKMLHTKSSNGQLEPDENQDNYDDHEHAIAIDDVIRVLRIDEVSFSCILEDVSKSARKLGKKKYEEPKSRFPTKKRSRSAMTKSSNDEDECNHCTLPETEEEEEEEEYHHLPRNGKAKYIAKEKFMEWKHKTLETILSGLTAEVGSSISQKRHLSEEMKKHADLIIQRYRDT